MALPREPSTAIRAGMGLRSSLRSGPRIGCRSSRATRCRRNGTCRSTAPKIRGHRCDRPRHRRPGRACCRPASATWRWHAAHRPASCRIFCEMSISASIERPMRSGLALSCSGSRAIRTGTRCAALIQLPVAICAGSSANALPVPTPQARDLAGVRSTFLPYTSAVSFTGWSMRMLRSCTSLKLASTHSWFSGTMRTSSACPPPRAGRAARCAWPRSRQPAPAARRAAWRGTPRAPWRRPPARSGCWATRAPSVSD